MQTTHRNIGEEMLKILFVMRLDTKIDNGSTGGFIQLFGTLGDDFD